MIVKCFHEFDNMLANLNIEISIGYLENLVKFVNKSNNIEIPSYIMCQRCNYLKGKFAMECKDYKTALIFFLKAREVKMISDAKIINSANKRIKKIIEMSQEKINENFNSNIVSGEVKMKTKELHQKSKSLLEVANKFAENNLISVTKQSGGKHRDILLLVDFSVSMRKEGGKKIKWTKHQIFDIFDNIVTNEHRFALFLYNQNFNPLINLCYKNEISNEYIKSIIDILTDETKTMGIESDEEVNRKSSFLYKNILKSYKYLVKKCK